MCNFLNLDFLYYTIHKIANRISSRIPTWITDRLKWIWDLSWRKWTHGAKSWLETLRCIPQRKPKYEVLNIFTIQLDTFRIPCCAVSLVTDKSSIRSFGPPNRSLRVSNADVNIFLQCKIQIYRKRSLIVLYLSILKKLTDYSVSIVVIGFLCMIIWSTY